MFGVNFGSTVSSPYYLKRLITFLIIATSTNVSFHVYNKDFYGVIF